MVYVIIGRKGKTVRYVGSKGKGKMRRLPVAVSTMKEAKLIQRRIKSRRKTSREIGWKISIKKI